LAPDDPQRADQEKPMRLQRILARAGLGSRRACEELITAGRVSVNGEVVRQLGVRAVPGADSILVDGRAVEFAPAVYLALNKPVGYICTSSDPEGRPRAVDLVRGVPGRLFTVGRLDADTSGLILITNDGDFSHAVSHPSRQITKVYEAVLDRPPTADALQALRLGVTLDDGFVTSPARVEPGPAPTGVTIAIHEGHKRQVRRMLDALGYRVHALRRTKVGPVELGDLAKGAVRHLTEAELTALGRREGP